MRMSILCFISPVLVLLSALTVRGQDPDLAQAKVQLQSWQKQIVSIRIQWRNTEEAKTNVMLEGTDHQTSLGEHDWVWEDSGRFRDVSLSYHDGRFIMRSTRLADTRYLYECGYPARDPSREAPSQVTIFENSQRARGSGLWEPPHWILWDSYSATWLGERLEQVTQATVSDEGMLLVDGTKLLNSALGFVVHLDPQHGYLPKLAEHPDIGGGISRFQVDEFREVEPGFWFPGKGSLLINGNILSNWEVTQVELNTELPDSLFVPPLGDETYVVNTLTGKQYWHGGKTPAHLLAEKAAAAAAQSGPAPVHNSQPLTGEPESAGNWSLWLALLGVVLVGVGVWVRRRA